MKYFIRSLKYLAYFVCLFVVIVAIIWFLSPEKTQGLPITSLFKAGSGWKLAIFFVAVAAIYPYLSFIRRKVYINGEFSEYKDLVIRTFSEAGLILESEEGTKMTFRMEKASMRFSRMWEDRITLETAENPLVLDGYRRDLDRLVRSLNYAIARKDNPQD